MKHLLKITVALLLLCVIGLSSESCTKNPNKKGSSMDRTTQSTTKLAGELEVLQSKLTESEQKYRTLTLALEKASRDGIVINALDGMTINANQAYLNMLGYTLEEIRSITYQQLTPEKWHAMEQSLFENQVMKRRFSDVYKKEYIRKDGSVFPIRIQAWLIRDEQGKPWRLLGLVHDVTDKGKK